MRVNITSLAAYLALIYLRKGGSCTTQHRLLACHLGKLCCCKVNLQSCIPKEGRHVADCRTVNTCRTKQCQTSSLGVGCSSLDHRTPPAQ
jgi:hypothetical protein